MKNRDNLYIGVAYSALDIPEHAGVMAEQWAEIGGHKCLGTFLLEKVEEKKTFKKFQFISFKDLEHQKMMLKKSM